MIIPWLLIWLLAGTPALHEWNGWLLTLIAAIFLA